MEARHFGWHGCWWPIPVCLGVPDTVRLNADRLLLRDQAGGLLGVLDVEAVFERDRAADRTCPHSGADHVALSGTQVRAMLAAGQLPPSEFSRPEVAELLIAAYQT